MKKVSGWHKGWEYDDKDFVDVKIVNGKFWYKDMIGEVVKVIEFDKNDEEYCNCYSYIACGEPSRAMINIEDAVRV